QPEPRSGARDHLSDRQGVWRHTGRDEVGMGISDGWLVNRPFDTLNELGSPANVRNTCCTNSKVQRGMPMSSHPGLTPFQDTALNLLFGLLALQNNFISRDVLVAAFGRWIADKSKPLDQILFDLGHLDADCHALLTGLVRQHLKLHGDNPDKSL